MLDQEGTLIEVQRDVPAPNPKFIVDDSPLKASIITIMSLVFFGVTLAGALMKALSAHDINEIRALLTRQDTIGWLTQVIAFLTPPFWLVYRALRSWWNKQRDVEIISKVDDSVAMTKTAAAAAITPESETPPPTRAPVTTMATRLVDGAVLLHRGGPLAPLPDEPAPVFTYDGGEPRPTVIAGVDVSRRDTDPAADIAPRIPGDALDAPIPSAKDD